MTFCELHAPETPTPESTSVTAEPPAGSILFNFPSTVVNAMARASGDQNGVRAPSVPAKVTPFNESSARTVIIRFSSGSPAA